LSDFIDLMLWGTGGPLMYAAIFLTVIAAAFLWTLRDWAKNIEVVPLNYIAEQRYRQPQRVSYPTNFGQVFATSACMSSVAYIPMGQYRGPSVSYLPGVE